MKPYIGFLSPADFRKSLAGPVANILYEDLRRIGKTANTGCRLPKKYSDISEREKQFWIDFSSGIPEKLISSGLFMRPFVDACRTCIITGEEMEAYISSDLGKQTNEPFISDRRVFYTGLNYLIPASLKKSGFELIRQEESAEVKKSLLIKIARVVHSAYLHEMMKQDPGKTGENKPEAAGFDNLAPEILESNIDFAVHLPTRLLAIGYRIRPVRKGFKPRALHLDDVEIETMAKVEHLRWSWEKRLNGWTWGEVRDTRRKKHPGLVPYEDLSENEKEKDRELVRLTPAILMDISYEAFPVSPGKISRLSYAIRPRSSIHKLLSGANELSSGISMLAGISPPIREKLRSVDDSIKLSISEVEGSYSYARHIQEAYLPDDLDIRECFPGSFVLFEPKDLVSGDFFLFNRHNGNIIFALADCTGHGIPAALISTIGYGILDQTVNILGITDPAEALTNLFAGIHRFLRKDSPVSGVSDDMEIILCNFDIHSGVLTYSGTGNILYHVTGGRISGNLSFSAVEENKNAGKYGFEAKRLDLKMDDTLYLCSDGFADQLGGGSHQRYTRKRLQEFLLEINCYPMPEQGDLLYEEFERWRNRNDGDEDQTDDITVIGIRI